MKCVIALDGDVGLFTGDVERASEEVERVEGRRDKGNGPRSGHTFFISGDCSLCQLFVPFGGRKLSGAVINIFRSNPHPSVAVNPSVIPLKI
jgi:hypothetical protein